MLDPQRQHRLRPAAGLDRRPRPRPAAGRLDRGQPQLRRRVVPRPVRGRPAGPRGRAAQAQQSAGEGTVRRPPGGPAAGQRDPTPLRADILCSCVSRPDGAANAEMRTGGPSLHSGHPRSGTVLEIRKPAAPAPSAPPRDTRTGPATVICSCVLVCTGRRRKHDVERVVMVPSPAR
jgi:hypothetical protein